MKEYIVEIKKLIPTEACRKIIEYFPVTGDATIGPKAVVDKTIRNCMGTNVIEGIDSFGKRIMFNYIQDKIFTAIKAYKEKWPHMDASGLSEVGLLKYECNNFDAGYKYHTDYSLANTKRVLSVSITLNNDYKGGEFIFDCNRDGEYQVPQNVGDCIIFPSNFMFPHAVKKITQGTRYALIAWVA